MEFSLKVHKRVLEEIGRSPSKLKVSVLNSLEVLLVSGHCSFPPFHIRYSATYPTFHLYAYKNLAEVEFREGVELAGSFKLPFDGTYWISGIQCISQKFPYYKHTPLSPPELNEDDYQTVDRRWCSEQRTDPFVAASVSKIGEGKNVIASQAQRLEHIFYHDLSQIIGFKKHAAWSGQHGMFNEYGLLKGISCKEFDVVNDIEDLNNCIDASKKEKGQITILNWVNDKDPWAATRKELSILLARYLDDCFPPLAIHLIDAQVQDEGSFEDIFRRFQHRPTSPFSHRPYTMVISNVAQAKEREKSRNIYFGENSSVTHLRAGEDGIEGFDLFHGCNHFESQLGFPTRKSLNKKYVQNLKKIIHEISRIAGEHSSYAELKVKDIRGNSNPKNDFAIFLAERQGIVVQVFGDNEFGFKCASDACCNALLLGMPNIVLVRANGPEGEIHISDHTDSYSVLNSSTLDQEAELFTAVLYNICNKYHQHRLHGFTQGLGC